MLYQGHLAWVGFELTMLVVIGTNCIGRCTFNCHTITPMTETYIRLKQTMNNQIKFLGDTTSDTFSFTDVVSGILYQYIMHHQGTSPNHLKFKRVCIYGNTIFSPDHRWGWITFRFTVQDNRYALYGCYRWWISIGNSWWSLKKRMVKFTFIFCLWVFFLLSLKKKTPMYFCGFFSAFCIGGALIKRMLKCTLVLFCSSIKKECSKVLLFFLGGA